MKLGKRDPVKKDAVKFGDFLKKPLTAPLPNLPTTDTPPAFTYNMDGNDVAGDCVCAGWDHFRQIVTGLLGTQQTFTQAQIWAFYQTQNPTFDPNGTAETNGPGSSADGGMDIQTFLEYLVENKYVVAFGSIDYTNEAEMKSAIYLGLAVITGVQLQEAQEQQFQAGQTLDYVAGSPVAGGHCIVLSGYQPTPDQLSIVTWGAQVQGTPAFITNQGDEAWFVVLPAHIANPAFRENFDLEGFSQAVSALTGGKVVINFPFTRLKLTTPYMQDEMVTYVQTQLQVTPIDGIYGPATKEAVVAFQTSKGLVADGIVGPLTYKFIQKIVLPS